MNRGDFETAPCQAQTGYVAPAYRIPTMPWLPPATATVLRPGAEACRRQLPCARVCLIASNASFSPRQSTSSSTPQESSSPPYFPGVELYQSGVRARVSRTMGVGKRELSSQIGSWVGSMGSCDQDSSLFRISPRLPERPTCKVNQFGTPAQIDCWPDLQSGRGSGVTTANKLFAGAHPRRGFPREARRLSQSPHQRAKRVEGSR